MEQIQLVRGAHSVGEANYHIVLVPAYRRPIFADPRVRELTMKYIKEKLAELGIVLVVAEFGPDHLHMFWSNVKRVGIGEAIRHVKGYSSRAMRALHRKLFVHLLWGKKFWTGGSFYRSIGAVTAERTAFYIASAEERHFETLDLEDWVAAKQSSILEFSSLSHLP